VRIIFIILVVAIMAACQSSCDVPSHRPGIGDQDWFTPMAKLEVTPKQPSKTAAVETTSTLSSQSTEGESNCFHDPAPKFSHPFTDLSMIDFISPIGVVSHSVIHHSYVWIGRDIEGEIYEVPIYAPVDSWLVGASYYSQLMLGEDGQWVDVAQYFLSFQVTCEVSYKFAHVDRVVDELLPFVPAEPAQTSRSIPLHPPIAIKAGELIGYTRGTITANNWDFGVYNRSRSNPFVNQERYEITRNLGVSLYADCPYDYFVGDVRDQIYDLLPVGECGSASADRRGTIAGAWFASPSYSPESGGSDLDIGVTFVPGGKFVIVRTRDAEIRIYPQDSTYLLPEEVSSEHCYLQNHGSPRFVYLKLVDEMELAVVFGEGECPASIPENPESFYR
jgi:hypothetical protein